MREASYRYARGRLRWCMLAALVFLVIVAISLLVYSVARLGVSDSIPVTLLLAGLTMLPVVAIHGVLDVTVSDKSIGRAFGRLSLKLVAWDHVSHALQVDVFHAGYGRAVRVYHLRTRAGSLFPALMFMSTIDDVECLLGQVNRMLAQRDIPIVHKDDMRRASIPELSLPADN